MASMIKNNYSVENVFLGNRFFIAATYTNGGVSPVNLVPGQVMGRILATRKVLPMASGASDGSEIPRFFCADYYTVPAGATVDIQVANRCDINQNLITLDGSDTLNTVVGTSGTIYDLLMANGDFKLIPSTELSNFDN